MSEFYATSAISNLNWGTKESMRPVTRMITKNKLQDCQCLIQLLNLFKGFETQIENILAGTRGVRLLSSQGSMMTMAEPGCSDDSGVQSESGVFLLENQSPPVSLQEGNHYWQ